MNEEDMKKQRPFLIDMTFPTSEMLGKHILSKLETTQAWVVPIYNDEPSESQICQLGSRPHLTTEQAKEIIKKHAIDTTVPIGDINELFQETVSKPDEGRLLKIISNKVLAEFLCPDPDHPTDFLTMGSRCERADEFAKWVITKTASIYEQKIEEIFREIDSKMEEDKVRWKLCLSPNWWQAFRDKYKKEKE